MAVTTTAQATPTGRLAELLTAIREQRGHWTTSRVFRFYRGLPSLADMGPGQVRIVARGDLRDLAAWGWLIAHDNTGRREYSLNTRKDATR